MASGHSWPAAPFSCAKRNGGPDLATRASRSSIWLNNRRWNTAPCVHLKEFAGRWIAWPPIRPHRMPSAQRTPIRTNRWNVFLKTCCLNGYRPVHNACKFRLCNSTFSKNAIFMKSLQDKAQRPSLPRPGSASLPFIPLDSPPRPGSCTSVAWDDAALSMRLLQHGATHASNRCNTTAIKSIQDAESARFRPRFHPATESGARGITPRRMMNSSSRHCPTEKR